MSLHHLESSKGILQILPEQCFKPNRDCTVTVRPIDRFVFMQRLTWTCIERSSIQKLLVSEQVRNLRPATKVALDFVAPESAGVAQRLREVKSAC